MGNELREACTALESDYARKREPGRWELAAIAFVASGHVDVQPWYHETADELWRECGFINGKPSYPTVHRRLRELWSVADERLSAAELVIQRCRKHDERVMAHVHFDFTEDETHAALVHDCQHGEHCKRRPTQTRAGRRRTALAIRLSHGVRRNESVTTTRRRPHADPAEPHRARTRSPVSRSTAPWGSPLGGFRVSATQGRPRARRPPSL